MEPTPFTLYFNSKKILLFPSSLFLSYKPSTPVKCSLDFIRQCMINVYRTAIATLHQYRNQSNSASWSIVEKEAFYLGDSSPVSSSPRTPCLNTVSNMPAVWYLSANAFSDGKKPICKLIVMDIVKKQWDHTERTKKSLKNMMV